MTILTTDPGICERCLHARLVSSQRAAYLRCGYADVDSGFLRYPALPVTACRAFDDRDEEGPIPEFLVPTAL